jgi:hypothetical protein
MGQEVDTQNKHIERITGKTDKVDDQIAMNRAMLDRIKWTDEDFGGDI